jgi:hypothetical protein
MEMKRALISASIVCAAVSFANGGSISIIGNLDGATDGNGSPVGEFADYSALRPFAKWPDTMKTVGDVSLSVSQRGVDGTLSSASWNPNGYPGAGSEINFQKGAGSVTDLAGAITARSFISFQLDTSVNSVLDNISVRLWRNGAAAAQNYRFAFDAGSDGFTSDDGIGAVASHLTRGKANTFELSAEVATELADSHEVRLYFWGSDATSSANSHLYEVSADYRDIPEASRFALLAGLLSLGAISLRRRPPQFF